MAIAIESEKVEVKTFIIFAQCPKCKAEMYFTGRVGVATIKLHQNHTHNFEHRCSKCSFIDQYDKQYPQMGYEPKAKLVLVKGDNNPDPITPKGA
jgi:predicted nucleic-acid-binding Zn-ribbon protein